jgi:hypothetical protein
LLIGPTDAELDELAVPTRLVVVALALYGGNEKLPVPETGAEWVCVTAVEFSVQRVVYVV